MDLKSIWGKANSFQGCLANLKTTMGRRRHLVDDDPLTMTNPFASDEAKIASSKSFRAMEHKTQVFSFPDIPFIRNRQTHTMEVFAVSVVAADMLGLNTDLVRAAALGHDIGHGPFGHQGEAWMKKAMGRPEFCHEVMGPIIAQKIERKGKGLNLTHETLEAMMCHSGAMAHPGMSQEAWVLRYTDKFTYIFHDVNDILVRMDYPAELKELRELVASFGRDQRERTTTALAGLIIESAEKGMVSFEDSDLARVFKRLRELMYEVYVCVTQQNVDETMGKLFEYVSMLNLGDPFLILALMTDEDARMLAGKHMKDMQAFNHTTVKEFVRHFPEIGPIDMCDPDLNW